MKRKGIEVIMNTNIVRDHVPVRVPDLDRPIIGIGMAVWHHRQVSPIETTIIET